MKNSTFSLSPSFVGMVLLAGLLYIVSNRLDWTAVNAVITTNMVHTCDTSGNNTAIPADLIATHIYVLDESLTVAIDTANYTFAVYDNAGTSGGCIESVSWNGDTCNINVGDDYVFQTLYGEMIFAGEK